MATAHKCKVCKKGIRQSGRGRPRLTHERCKKKKTTLRRKTTKRKTTRKKTTRKKTTRKKTTKKKTTRKKTTSQKNQWAVTATYNGNHYSQANDRKVMRAGGSRYCTGSEYGPVGSSRPTRTIFFEGLTEARAKEIHKKLKKFAAKKEVPGLRVRKPRNYGKPARATKGKKRTTKPKRSQFPKDALGKMEYELCMDEWKETGKWTDD